MSGYNSDNSSVGDSGLWSLNVSDDDSYDEYVKKNPTKESHIYLKDGSVCRYVCIKHDETAQVYPDELSEQSIEMMKKYKLKFPDLDVYPPGCDAWVHYEYRTGKMMGTLTQIVSDFTIRELNKSSLDDFKRFAKEYIESRPDELKRIVSYCTYQRQMTIEEMIHAVYPNAFVLPQFRNEIAFVGDGK